jgi:ribose 1,5-bisphosphokinase PhnN
MRDETGTARRPLLLLHLSELRFGRGAEPAAKLAARLAADVKQGLDPDHAVDLLVVTGDLSENGRPSELREAVAAVHQLADLLRLPRERAILLPGDRDINRDFCAAYFSDCLAEEREPEPPYRPKWRSLAAVLPGFSERLPWTFHEVPELGLAVAALNSTLPESHRPEDHDGLVGDEQLQWFAARLDEAHQRGRLCLAAVHHDRLRDTEAIETVLGDRLHLLLHGHADGLALDRLADAAVIGAGQPEDDTSALHHYRLILLEPDRLRVRGRALPAGRDIPGVAEGIEIDEPARFPPAPFTALPAPERPGAAITAERPEDEAAERDDFLARVEAACRLREPGTEVRRLREGTPPIEYLRVSRSEGGMVRLYPVGALERGADRAGLAAFLERVDARYREADSGLVSLLVYGGDRPAPPELVREAADKRVRLLSFLELQGLIDFRAYVDRQSERLRRDPVYPPSLYVPQRLRWTAAFGDEETADAAGTLLDWLSAPHGRFILAMGDSGAGKSFLLRELARRLAERNGLIPILIELRHLEKARTLDQLLGQHFAREGVEDFSPGRFRYMLEQGRIALLFDGFDELATRVTYARAAEHFDALLQAAAGAAKAVVTCRRQHFESDRRVKTLLGEQIEQLAGRRIAHLQPFDREQIRTFLARRTGDPARGDERLALIEQVGDLAGLANNPRMLGFIAELPEERLRRARATQGEITAASLYRLLLGRWLGQEIDRANPDSVIAPPLLSFSERLEAVTRIALRLWRTEDGSLDLADLTEEVSRAVAVLRRAPIDAEAAAFQVGSGTLLLRDEEGSFSFLHPSIMEWLVARRASEELTMGSVSETSETLASRDLSPLMADFFIALAGRETALTWARRALVDEVHDPASAAKSNALLVLRLLGEEPAEPVDLAGRNLRGADLSGEDLPGADLTAADLTAAGLSTTSRARTRPLRRPPEQHPLQHRQVSPHPVQLGVPLRNTRQQPGVVLPQPGVLLAKLPGQLHQLPVRLHRGSQRVPQRQVRTRLRQHRSRPSHGAQQI